MAGMSNTTTPNATHPLSDAVAAELEAGIGNQMDLIVQTLRRLERADWHGCDGLCELGTDLKAALAALDAAFVAVAEYPGGASDEDEAVQAMAAEQLAAVHRRLSLTLAARIVSDIAGRLGKAMCQPETLREGAAVGVQH